MAVSVGDSAGDGVDLEGIVEEEFPEAHEINVTPFIDVMLVLLIIFMVAAPLATVDLPVDLPTATASAQRKPDKPVYVTIKADLAVAVGETLVTRGDLVRAIDATGNDGDHDRDRRIAVRADRAVPYGELMDVLEIVRSGGYAKVALEALERASPPAAGGGR